MTEETDHPVPPWFERMKELEARLLKAGAQLEELTDTADNLRADDIPRLIEGARTIIREIAACTTDSAMLAGLRPEQAKRARAEILTACTRWEADIVAFLSVAWQEMERYRGVPGERSLTRQ